MTMQEFGDVYSLISAGFTVPWALWFIILYCTDEGWWSYRREGRSYPNWFGRSLMLIAVAVLLSSAGTVLFRIFGFNYPLRTALVVAIWTLTPAAMVMRTLVLWRAKRGDRRRVLDRH